MITMKKTYFSPTFEMIRISSARMMATSFSGDDNTGGSNVSEETGDGTDYSNSFRGGVLWEED